MDLKITDYLPEINDISSETLKETRSRIVKYLQTKEEFQSVDMRPNSVMGDLVISPIAHLLAAFEVGSSRMFSDLDLSNVSAGTVYNCAFVKKYLNNFGQGQVYEYPSTGVVQLQFSNPKTKFIDAGSKFLFSGDGGENHIYEMVGITDLLTLKSPFEESDLNNSQEKKLVRIAENVYMVNVAVKGPAGVGVNDGTNAATDIPDADLISAKAVGDFDRGTLPENIMELALKVQRTFYSSSLNNRTGAISFMLQTFPEMRGVSPVLTGDLEMTRDRENVLGVREGKLDLYFKSRDKYLTTEQEIRMSYDPTSEKWRGSCDFIEPPTWIDEIRRASSLQSSVISNTHGKSLDGIRFPNETSAYSRYEVLGFEVEDDLLSEDIPPRMLINGEENSYTDTDFTYEIQGKFVGHVFSSDYTSRFSLSFLEIDNTGTQKIKGYLKDKTNNVTKEVAFVQSDVANRGVIEDIGPWEDLATGTALHIEGGAAFDTKMQQLVGKSLDIDLTARGGTFVIRYRYDPNFSIVNRLASNNDVAPVNTDVAVKNFLTCYVYSLNIEYRKKEGQNVDLIKSKEEIVNYLNRISYPHVYEEYIIAEILLYYGAEGLHKITQTGQFFKSLADKYHTEDGIVDIHAPLTEDLQAPDSDGIGSRNVNYILDSANVNFNAIII